MIKIKFYYILTCIRLVFFVFSLVSCGSSNSENDDFSEEEFAIEGQTADGFEDGTYCANVSYYNPNTGTSNTYTLEVEVDNNEVVQINWGNGGWMDEDHFSAQDLDGNGYCSFSSDKGYDYTVQITSRDCGSTDQSSIESDIQEDEEAVSCTKCGGEKEEYDAYCHSCTSRIEDEEENTCSRCGGYEIGVFGGLCSSCEDSEY